MCTGPEGRMYATETLLNPAEKQSGAQGTKRKRPGDSMVKNFRKAAKGWFSKCLPNLMLSRLKYTG